MEVLVVTENGYGKRTKATEYGVKGRGGKGMKTANITERNGALVGLATVRGDEDIMMINDAGVIIRFAVADVSETGRSTQGVRLMRMTNGAKVVTMSIVDPEEEDVEADTTVENTAVEENSTDTNETEE
jgi:DNA gyrase subunit A